MLRGLCLVLLATACIAGGAHAQVYEVPRPYAIPLPPGANAPPQWELGLRYWWSEGSTRFDINSSKKAPLLGNPTSTLTYDGINANALEFVWSARNETRTFAKGFVGGGWLDGGSLDDEDFFVGQIKFSDTFSRLDGDDLIYGTIDVGQDFTLVERARANLVVSPFVGINYWEETVDGYGARCNPDDVGGAFCGPAGSIAVPFSTRVITNEASWASIRLGAEIKAKLWNRLTLRGDLAIVPGAYLWNEDSHYLRTDLGRVPNIEDHGTGWGYQLEGEVRLDVTDCWALGAGVRYWYAETNGKSDFVNLGVTTKLQDFESERFGVFGNATYRFSTF
ncbi:MAG: hypothetical protein ACRECX_02000 [Methyloceanibacter sp.]|uniref:hypothetical protein n=1 Tax=Methyloceanibacter sp. TaxID=1965321 RepID=UPI003D6D3ADB